MVKSVEYRPANYIWSKENCKIEALKYNSKIDFKKNSKGAYPSALKNNWIDEICSHMIPKGNKYKRLIYRFIFPDNYCYIGLTCDFERRKKDHFKNFDSPVFNHMKKTNLIPICEKLTEYIDVYESKYQEEYWKIKSEEQGYSILNISKTGALGSNTIKWTKEKCAEEALKYEYRPDFSKSFAYRVSYNNGWADEICSHMRISKFKPNGYWTKERCREESLKYEKRFDYYLEASGSHESARKNKWLDEICSHMTKKRRGWNYWNLENCKEEALKYATKELFKRKNTYVYKILLKNDLLDEIFKK